MSKWPAIAMHAWISNNGPRQALDIAHIIYSEQKDRAKALEKTIEYIVLAKATNIRLKKSGAKPSGVVIVVQLLPSYLLTPSLVPHHTLPLESMAIAVTSSLAKPSAVV